MDSPIRRAIAFYRDCFEEENTGGGIWNFLTTKVEHHQLIEPKEEHLTGFLPYTPVVEEVAKGLQEQIAVYRKEKELVYAGLFLLGKYTNTAGKEMRLIAPVITYPAEVVEEEELFYLKANRERGSINPAVLEVIRSANPEFNEDRFWDKFPTGPLTEVNCLLIARLLERELPNLNTSRVVDYPNTLNDAQIKRLFRNHGLDDRYELVPATGVGIIQKSVSTRSILTELGELMRPDLRYSTALSAFFSESADQRLAINPVDIQPAAVLSRPQENVLQAASNYTLSQVVGPPGTGKSFTIANLAIDLMSRGQSVLIASRMDGAVNVIEEKIFGLLGDKSMCVRGGKRDRQKALKNRLQFLLSRGSITTSNQTFKKGGHTQRQFRREERLKKLRWQLAQFEEQFLELESVELERGYSIQQFESESGLWNRILNFFLRKRIQKPGEVRKWDVVATYLDMTKELVSMNRQHINDVFLTRIHHTIARERDVLRDFLQALKASTSARQDHFFQRIDHGSLFKVFPIWLTNARDVGEVVPLQKELFDVVIIDEATQCDVATCLPLLQRAKRAVIVGDPKQLRHISFLSRVRQYQLQVKHDIPEAWRDRLNYRDNSILDLCEVAIRDQEQVSFLNEHYRSRPEIIDFSNRTFYFGELNIMTRVHGQEADGLVHLPTEGRRDEFGHNPEEAQRIFKLIRQVIREEEALMDENKSSIGILSPFRAQVDYIGKGLSEAIGLDNLTHHNILIGTAHTFQGEERDIMFLSLVLDNESHGSAFHFLHREDVFNVSITRAKNKQFILTSFGASRLSTDSITRQYLESLNRLEPENQDHPSDYDQFCREVIAFLHTQGAQARVGYDVAGIHLDVVGIIDSHLVGIDLIGHPGRFEEAIELHKYKALLRVNIDLLPLPYTLWKYQRAECEAKITEVLRASNHRLHTEVIYVPENIEPGPLIIINICNTVQVWRYPKAFEDLGDWAKARENFEKMNYIGRGIGDTGLMEVAPKVWVVNLFGQHNVVPDSQGKRVVDYDGIREGLKRVKMYATVRQARVLYSRPALESTGVDWEKVENLLKETLLNEGVPVLAYGPNPVS